MRTIALVCAVVLLYPAWASQQEPAPMVLTFDKIPEDGSCAATYQITNGIRQEDAGSQVRLTIDPWILKGDHLQMRMLLADCGWQAAEKGNSEAAALRWGAGFVLAALDDIQDSKRLADSYNEALAIAKSEFADLQANQEYIATTKQYIWALEDTAGVPHVFAAPASSTAQPKQTKKRAFLDALRGALVGGAAGYADYQRALASRQPVHCTGQQMAWLFSFSCQ